MRYLFGLILLLALAAGVAYVVAGRGGGPSIQIAKPEKFVGVSTPVEVVVGAPGANLKTLKIVFDQNGKQTTLYEMTGGYGAAFVVNSALLLLAALLSITINERSRVTPQLVPVAGGR